MLLWYGQRNPVRAKLAKRASDWKHGAKHVRKQGLAEIKALLTHWPIDRSRGFDAWVNRTPDDLELKTIRERIRRSRPMGDAQWIKQTAEKLNLGWTLRPHGRSAGKAEKSVRELRPLQSIQATRETIRLMKRPRAELRKRLKEQSLAA